ncbi:hypothetical protein [Sphaerothrix gracilis]|uniref:hypothetical protein n=1 Tax=Sphaerothrix gracilis TaxID=3151835 RepID=UPI0031FDE820
MKFIFLKMRIGLAIGKVVGDRGLTAGFEPRTLLCTACFFVLDLLELEFYGALNLLFNTYPGSWYLSDWRNSLVSFLGKLTLSESLYADSSSLTAQIGLRFDQLWHRLAIYFQAKGDVLPRSSACVSSIPAAISFSQIADISLWVPERFG